MTDWLFNWKAITLGTILVLVSAGLGFAYRDTSLGNIAGVVGLAVSVLGFVVTIWTVLDAQKQITAAGDRAEIAMLQMRDEARLAIEQIAAQLFAADCSTLRSGVEDLRQATQDKQWPRAIYRCQECRIIAIRLSHDQRLSDNEKVKLIAGADDLRKILRFIEKKLMSGQRGDLGDLRLRSLDGVIGLLARIQARMHHESLRPPERPSGT